MSNEPKSEESAQQVRRRLVEIADELRSLSAEDFPGKHRLNTEADELRAKLTGLVASDAELRDGWAKRAGRKGAHTHDPELAKAAIVSSIESGGGV